MPGRPVELPPEEVLEHMHERDELLHTSPAIADEVGKTRATVTDRLHQLEDDGLVREKKAGRASVWYPTDMERYQIIAGLDTTDEDLEEVLSLVAEYGVDTVREAVEIVEGHPELGARDVTVLQEVAAGLAAGEDRGRVLKTVEAPKGPSKLERWVGGVSEIVFVSGALVTAYALLASGFPVLPSSTGLLALGAAELVVGAPLFVLTLLLYNLRRIGAELELPGISSTVTARLPGIGGVDEDDGRR